MLLLLCLGGTLAAIIYFIGRAIYKTIAAILEAIYWMTLSFYKYLAVERPMKKSGFYDKKVMELKMIQAEKDNKHKEQILNNQNMIIKAGLNKVRELRVRFPFADEQLFQMFLKEFPSLNVDEIKEFEVEIKKSHISNEIFYKTNTIERKFYTLADLNGINSLDEYNEDPLNMKIFKIEKEYVLLITNSKDNTTQLFQSYDYLVVARTINKLMDIMKQTNEVKRNIKSKDISELFKDIDISIRDYRKNNMGFID